MRALMVVALIGCNPDYAVHGPDRPPDAVPGDPDQPADPDADLPEDLRTPARVAFMGDAVTVGEGASSTDARYAALMVDNHDALWPDAAALDLESLYPELTAIVDVSSVGDNTSAMSEFQTVALADAFPDDAGGETVVFITAGTDELFQAMGIVARGEESLADMDAVVYEEVYEQIGEVSAFLDGFFDDHPTVLVANVADPTDGAGTDPDCYDRPGDEQRFGMLQTANRAVADTAADHGLVVVDVHARFAGHGLQSTEPWFADCEYPDDRGHHEIRVAFYEALLQALSP